MIRITISILAFLPVLLMSQQTLESVLATGTVYKMGIPESGIYKVTFEALSQNTDIDLSALDPDAIHIHGNPGGLLPLENASPRKDDLVENPVLIGGGDDGRFGPGDYILFYAEGADRIISSDNELVYEKNIYDQANYYYIKIDASYPGLRVQQANPVSAASVTPYTDVLVRHEIDEINLLGSFGGTQGSGKQWFGETFTANKTTDFSEFFQFGELANEPSEVVVVMSARSEINTEAVLNIDGETYRRSIIKANLGDVETTYAHTAVIREDITLSTSRPEVVITYEVPGTSGVGWLDYIEIKTKERINVPSSGLLDLYDIDAKDNGTAGFELGGNVQGKRVWQVTDPERVQEMSLTGTTFGYEPGGQIHHFVVFDPDQSNNTPISYEQVENQNLHGITSTDMVIIYHPMFIDAANKLAAHRAQHDGLRIELVDILNVYNEFGGGKADPISIRDMCKMIRERDDDFRYLLLLGDASYDYRGINPNIEFQNFVPSYQTDQSLNPINAFPADDYFGLLSDDEGSDNMTGDLELGIGRIPAHSVDQAMAVVDKIIHYETGPDRYGDWRTRISFSADDVDKTVDVVHARDADEIARETAAEHECLHQQKVYLDAFVQEATPGGARYPDANAAIRDNLNKGQLVWSYLGHGGPRGLSQERVLQVNDVRNWVNKDKLSIFITATCSFTGFDEPAIISAGEHLIANPNGGAVAIFTTVRSVFANSNKRLTSEVYENIFERGSDGLPLRLGDILTNSQNNSSASITNSRKFLLIGDPSMKIAMPEHRIVVDEVNGVAVTPASSDTLGALSQATLSGHVETWGDSTLLSGFSGKVFLTVFDKASQQTTLLNDGPGTAMDFTLKKNVLYKGSATVTNGEFQISFILPRDIDFSFGPGSLFLYATDETTTDAKGFYDQIIIGGTSGSTITDNEGPEIDIFFNDRSFIFGGKTNSEPVLLVDLEDENGINLSSTSIGHDITASLEDQNGEKIVLNEFYEPTVDKIGAGTVRYQMPSLEPGLHKIYIKAWDILNNSSEEMSEFFVTEDGEGFIENVFNFPNPFSTRTSFTFEHDLVGSEVEVLVSIYTLSGKLVKTISENRFSGGSRISDVAWDARDDFGNRLAKGIYLYKIKVYSPQFNVSRESDFRKMAILY